MDSYRLTGSDLDALCECALRRSLDLLPASLGVVLLPLGNGEFRATDIQTSGDRSEDYNLCSELVEEAPTSNRPVIVADTSKDPRTAGLFEQGIRSVAAIPLRHSGESLGFMYLDSTEPLDSTSGVGAQICDLMAGQLSAEIQLARIATVLVETRRALVEFQKARRKATLPPDDGPTGEES